MRIVSDKKCFGCAACCDICPKDAVSMNDAGGFWRPVIDETRCVQCGLCQKVCPARKETESLRADGECPKDCQRRKETERACSQDIAQTRCYAAWSRNRVRHAHSASGGLAGELAEEVLRNGGFTAGVIFDRGSGIVLNQNMYSAVKRVFTGKQNGGCSKGRKGFLSVFHVK